ncbi:MAG: GNAT family N-acetyltransferase [Betaproteobacteria bacterium]|nr:GNAT family N-acetyltransferase [Betaproteobacteria bacterium]
MVRVAPLAVGDVDRLCALAAEIWHRHYPAIISAAQIEYMLRQRYDPGTVREELQRKDLWWDQLLVDGEITGFASYFLTGNAGEMKLDKLYVHHDHQRKGYGGMLLDRALGIARAYGCDTLTLAVNKNNRNAIAAYRKYGFHIAESVAKDIGSGFVMDDYVMTKSI